MNWKLFLKNYYFFLNLCAISRLVLGSIYSQSPLNFCIVKSHERERIHVHKYKIYYYMYVCNFFYLLDVFSKAEKEIVEVIN